MNISSKSAFKFAALICGALCLGTSLPANAKPVNHLNEVSAVKFDNEVSDCVNNSVESMGTEKAKSYCQCFIKTTLTKYSEKQISKWTVEQRDKNLTPIESKCMDESLLGLVDIPAEELQDNIAACTKDVTDTYPKISQKQATSYCECHTLLYSKYSQLKLTQKERDELQNIIDDKCVKEVFGDSKM